MNVRCTKYYKELFAGLYYFILIFSVAYLSSCNTNEYVQGNGVYATGLRHLPSFSAIDIQGNYEVKLIQDKKDALEIKADENIIPHIVTEVHNDTLKIYNKEKIKGNDKIQIVINFQDISSINCGGASSIKCSSMLSTNDMVLKMTGTGLMDLELEAETLDLFLSGTGLINLSGHVEKENINLSGAGKLNAPNLISKECNIDLSGIGSALIHVEDHLNAQLSGVGGITYKGNPSIINRDIAGIGTITQEKD